MNSQMKRYIGRVWELLEHRSFRPPVELGCLTLQVWMCSPTWMLSEPCTIGIWWNILTWPWSIINSISSPFPLSGEGKEGPKIPRFQSWLGLCGDQPLPGGTQSRLIRTRGDPSALITQEIPRVLGALCQEPEAETNMYIFYYHPIKVHEVGCFFITFSWLYVLDSLSPSTFTGAT